MFFNKKQGFVNQPPMVNMDPNAMQGMPYENYEMDQVSSDGMYASHTEAGCNCTPYGYCAPYYEHTEVDVDCPKPEVHIVLKGETVYKIAKKHGLDWRELAGYNHLGNPDKIYPGERLLIPPEF